MRFDIKYFEMMVLFMEIIWLIGLTFLIYGYQGLGFNYYFTCVSTGTILIWRLWLYGKM